jgi:hypothetical protein
MDEQQLLPKRTAELASVIGLEATLIIVKQFGGTHLNIPKKAKPQHPLVSCIGFAAFKKLCHYYGGTPLEIDLCADLIRQHKQQLIIEGINAGMTHAQLARQFGTTERQIRRIKQRTRCVSPVIQHARAVNLDIFELLVGG